MVLKGRWGKVGRPPKSAYSGPAQEPTVTQKNYLGAPETLLRRIYLHQIKCRSCNSPRWVKPADRHQVKYCKPCTRKFRLARRKARAKAKSRRSD